MRINGRSVPFRAAALAVTLTLLGTLAATTPSASAATAVGPVDVLYAGSLTTLMNQHIGPAFHAATGGVVSGFAGGSDALASQIQGQVEPADVFISASPDVNTKLEGAAGGGWVTWYATFATSPLVIGYDPHSSFAHALQTKPWYEVLAESGIQVGRTDPATDPKGKLADEALNKAAQLHHMPQLAGMTSSTTNVFPEETLVGRLQAGQLDAGFFYTAESKAAGIPSVSLGPDYSYKATYTVTVLARAPHEAAAISFVSFLLSKQGTSILSRYGLTRTKVAVSGPTSAVPTALRGSLGLR
jgi:molybdate/tungstate transport system substrate-binding protein